MDDNYQTYLNRVARMTLPEAYGIQVQHILESSKFQPTPYGKRQAVPFPGYTVISQSQEQTENSAFYNQLHSYQQELLQLPVGNDLIVPVPPASFHLTLADLIWDSAFRDACEKNPNYEQQLCSCFAEIFQQYQQSLTRRPVQPLRWQILGLMIMPRAVGVCLVPQDQTSYEEIVNFRRAIYQNPNVIALGIEQQYHFTAHVTLGYFGEVSPDLDRDRLALVFSQLNQQWLLNTPEFVIQCAELRKFDDMTHYYREADWPILEFS